MFTGSDRKADAGLAARLPGGPRTPRADVSPGIKNVRMRRRTPEDGQ